MSFQHVTNGSTASKDVAIDTAFAQKPNLRKRIHEAIDLTPSLTGLFEDIAQHVQTLQHLATSGAAESEEPLTKKRKLDDSVTKSNTYLNGEGNSSLEGNWESTPIGGISFSVPQRKKLSLQISTKVNEGIRALNPSTNQKEFGIPWGDIEHVLCLPVPEKAQAARNFCVFPRCVDGIPRPPGEHSNYEPMVWTAPGLPIKDADEEEPNPSTTMIKAIEQAGFKVQQPNEKDFVSQVIQGHRKGEKAYHVKAFRGSKDGFLFFLPIGIAWVFKKPLLFFSFSTVTSISYTSVLQRTFDLNIAVPDYLQENDHADGPTKDFEFSMIDQADFAGINAYVEKYQLQDASMAEQRRAKKYNVDGVKGEEEEGKADGETELEKARRELEEQEDEDEEEDENFDPGSEGESEGSGTSDEEEEDEREGRGEDKDLVEEELGSERESEE